MKKKYLGWIIIPILSFTPLIFWFAEEQFSLRIFNFTTILISLGEVTALIGMTMFALTLILSTRLKSLEGFFGGMNNMYKAHHIYGGIAFLFLLIHPLFLAFSKSIVSFFIGAKFLLPGDDWTINTGIASLYFMMSLLILTFFVNLPYQIWKFTHKFLGAVFILGILHSFFVSSDILRYAPLKNYMLIISIISVIGYCYRTVFSRFFVRHIIYTVTQIEKLNDNTTEIHLTSQKGKMKFHSGQFVFISFKQQDITQEYHPFSISSAPNDTEFSLIIKSEGDYTSHIKNLKLGTTAVVEGSFGAFSYEKTDFLNQIWIAGGIGITPFLSMAETLNNNPQITVDIYYSVHDQNEAFHLDELLRIAKQNQKIRVFPFFTSIQGRLTADYIAKNTKDITKTDIFFCGPPPMMHALKMQFKKLKVKSKYMHSEEFSW